MRCPNCGRDNPQGAQLCGSCGNVLSGAFTTTAGDWEGQLSNLRTELSRIRAIRQSEKRRHIDDVNKVFEELGIEQRLIDLNDIVLDGQGEVEIYEPLLPGQSRGPDRSSDTQPVEMNNEEETDVATKCEDSILASLVWEEAGQPKRVDVELGWLQGRLCLLINGTDVRPDISALEQALVRAFKEAVGM